MQCLSLIEQTDEDSRSGGIGFPGRGEVVHCQEIPNPIIAGVLCRRFVVDP